MLKFYRIEFLLKLKKRNKEESIYLIKSNLKILTNKVTTNCLLIRIHYLIPTIHLLKMTKKIFNFSQLWKRKILTEVKIGEQFQNLLIIKNIINTSLKIINN